MGYEPISTLKREIFGIKERVEIVITHVYNVSPGLGHTMNEHTKKWLCKMRELEILGKIVKVQERN